MCSELALAFVIATRFRQKVIAELGINVFKNQIMYDKNLYIHWAQLRGKINSGKQPQFKLITVYAESKYCTATKAFLENANTLHISRMFFLCMLSGITVGAGKVLGGRRIFARISSNLPEKCVCRQCFHLQIFHRGNGADYFCCDRTPMTRFFRVTSKKVSKVFMCFLFFFLRKNRIKTYFVNRSNWSHYLCPNFPGFLTNQNIWVCACIPASTPKCQALTEKQTQASSMTTSPHRTQSNVRTVHICHHWKCK